MTDNERQSATGAGPEDRARQQAPSSEARGTPAPATTAQRRLRSWLLAVAGGILITVVAGLEINGVPSSVQEAIDHARAHPLRAAAGVATFPVTTIAAFVSGVERDVLLRAYHAIHPQAAPARSGHGSG